MAINKYLSILTLNVNGLSAPVKTHRVAEWIRKSDPHICCLEENHLRTKDLHRLSEVLEENIMSKWTRKKVEVAIPVS